MAQQPMGKLGTEELSQSLIGPGQGTSLLGTDGHRDEDMGDVWGSRGCFTPTINICIFFFYPVCTYSVGRALCQHSIRAQGDPKMSRDVPKTGEQGDAQYGHCGNRVSQSSPREMETDPQS